MSLPYRGAFPLKRWFQGSFFKKNISREILQIMPEEGIVFLAKQFASLVRSV